MKVKKEFKAGIIVLVSILAFWWLFQFLKGRNIFSSEDIYYIKYDKVDNLSKSKNVNINGLKVGTVEAIVPVPRANKNISFVVEIKVNKDFKFSKNSVAQIENSFMSGADINLILAEDNAETAQSGDTLKGSIAAGVFDIATQQLKPLSNNTNQVLLKLDSTLSSVNKLLNENNRARFDHALVNLDKTLGEFNTLAKNANNLVSANSSKLATTLDNTNNMMVSLNSTVDQYGSIAKKINNSDLENTIKNLENTLKDVNNLTKKVNSGQGSMGKLMNDDMLYENLTDASKNLSLLLEDLKANPKRYVHFSIFGGGNKEKKKEKKEKS